MPKIKQQLGSSWIEILFCLSIFSVICVANLGAIANLSHCLIKAHMNMQQNLLDNNQYEEQINCS